MPALVAGIHVLLCFIQKRREWPRQARPRRSDSFAAARRHARACRGHPRPSLLHPKKTWMAGSSPATTAAARRHARACRGHPRLSLTHPKRDVDGRVKPGHDEVIASQLHAVMPALVAGIHVLLCFIQKRRGWPRQARPRRLRNQRLGVCPPSPCANRLRTLQW
jgi:hypothetical protein